MQRRTYSRLLILTVMLISVACRKIESPIAPDMSGIVAAYAGPTAALDGELAEAGAMRLIDQVRTVQTARGLTLLSTLVNAIQPEMMMMGSDAGPRPDTEPGVPVGGLRLVGNGYLTIDTSCPGWMPDDPQAGSLHLTVLVVDTTISEVIWGTVNACRFVVEDTRLLVDGEIDTALDQALGFENFEPQHITARAEFAISTEANPEQVSFAFDFRTLIGGALEFRLEGANGTHVIARLTSDVWEIEATNGTFGCDFGAKRCTRGDTGESITW